MKNKNKFAEILPYGVAGVYFLFLVWLILFKLADSIERIPSMRGINLIPFHYDEFSGTLFHWREVADNILVFIPAGFYLTAFYKGKFLSGLAASAVLSLSFEALQYVFALGASDITDLITNTIGGCIGAGLFFLTGRLFKGRQVTVVSIIGAVLEALFVLLLIILIIGNMRT